MNVISVQNTISREILIWSEFSKCCNHTWPNECKISNVLLNLAMTSSNSNFLSLQGLEILFREQWLTIKTESYEILSHRVFLRVNWTFDAFFLSLIVQFGSYFQDFDFDFLNLISSLQTWEDNEYWGILQESMKFCWLHYSNFLPL